jgi:DNA-binding transcriptional ArsR family regulator
MSGAEPQLDPLLADATRLSILALLASSHWPEFSFVRDSVAISDSALSKQVSMLEKHHYVDVKKGYVGKRPRTWLNITQPGLTALALHVRALERIVEQCQDRLDPKQPA